jgi:hypothetical protein
MPKILIFTHILYTGNCLLYIHEVAVRAQQLASVAQLVRARGPTRPHEAYEISKSRDFEPDFLISNLISKQISVDL